MYDVIVIGGGIVGASAAYALTQDKLNVCLIEQFEAGHNQGSSHGDGRIVRFNYTESIYVEMAKLAFPAWEALSERAGQALIQKTGLIEYGPDGSLPIAESQRILSEHGIPYEMLSPTAAGERFPQMRFADNTQVLYQPDGAVAFATSAVKALWRLIAADGGTTLMNTRIEAIEPEEDRVTVRSIEGQEFTAKRLVITAGAWVAKLLQQVDVHIPVEITQEVLAYFRSNNPNISHRVGEMPILIDYHDVESPYYSLPQIEVAGVKMGWHHSGPVIDPDERGEASQKVIQQIEQAIASDYRYLETNPFEVQTCLYTNTPDYHFVLDTLPQQKNIVVGAGFSGHGFKFGPVLGRFLANLVQGKVNPLALDAFRISRFDQPENLAKRVGA